MFFQQIHLIENNLNGEITERSRDLFLKYGIRNITMDKLSADLGISKKTLYRTIPKKTPKSLSNLTNSATLSLSALDNLVYKSSEKAIQA